MRIEISSYLMQDQTWDFEGSTNNCWITEIMFICKSPVIPTQVCRPVWSVDLWAVNSNWIFSFTFQWISSLHGNDSTDEGKLDKKPQFLYKEEPSTLLQRLYMRRCLHPHSPHPWGNKGSFFSSKLMHVCF